MNAVLHDVPDRFTPRLLMLWLVLSQALAAAGGVASESGHHQGPCAAVASPDSRTLYVACADSRQVAWIDLGTGQIVRRIDVPAEPTGLALSRDAGRLIVSCAAPASVVAVFDAETGDQVAEISAGHTAMSPVVSPDGKHVYVCNRFDNDVSVIDLEAGREVSRIAAVREPVAAAVTPDGRTLVVANHLPQLPTDGSYSGDVSPLVSLVDLGSGATSGVGLPHGSNSVRGVCVTADGKHALVTHLLGNFEMIPFRVDTGWIDVNVVSIVDLAQHKAIGTIGLDYYDLGAANPREIICTPDGSRVYVSLSGTHEVAVIDTEDLLGEFARRTMQPMMAVWPIYISLGESLWRRIALPGKGPRGMAVVGSKLHVAQYFSDTVAVVDWQESGEPRIDSIPLGPEPELTAARRGELLFNDATICHQQWLSCASCHPDGRTDGLNWDLQNDGVGNSKNTKSMLLAHETPPAMAVGVRESAEYAVRSGIIHILFAQRPEEEAAAIDAYLKSLRPVPSPHLVDGKLSEAAERGKELFSSDRVGCHRCHPAPLYTDLKSHNVGTRNASDRGDVFDSPTLIEAWRTAPYLHDGRYTSIRELLVEGRHGLRGSRHRDLTDQQLADLVEFVLSL